MDFLPIHLFPERALDASVITTVWLGVMIGALLNLRFGWLLTGLIVPGYLVPLLIQKPMVVAVVVLEAILAYGLVWLFSERMPRLGLWSNSFGMDRFLAVILSAVLVRVVMDGAVLPMVAEWVNRSYHLNFDYRTNLQSFGLSMTALMTYGFVRAGLGRGFVTLSIHLFLTWVLVYFVLMKFTNFNLAGLSFLYEEVASSVLSSPKTYIIMIVTAIVASRMNLAYGWDFNGILVPAFIAMQWNQPLRLLATFVEAMAVLFACRALLRLPMFQRMTLEKGRQIILFFTVSFIYKALIGYLVPLFNPEARIHDFFGFGYVLCALIAMRIHTKEIGIKLTSCTLQTSLAAVLLATGIGFAFAQAKPSLPWLATSQGSLRGPGTGPAAASPETHSLDTAFEALRVGMYAVRTQRVFQQPLPGELERFRDACRLLAQDVGRTGETAAAARRLLGEIDFDLIRLENRYWLIQERTSRRGWGFFILDPESDNRLHIEVPAPMEEPGSCTGGYRIFRLLGARSFASATNLRRPGRDTNLDPLLSPRTFLAVWHQTLGLAGTLQVRGGSRVPQLRVKRELPEGLDVVHIERRVGNLGTRWAPVEGPNLLADLSRTRFAEISLPARTFLRLEPSSPATSFAPIEDGPLLGLLERALASVPPEGTEHYRPPRVDELLFMDEEVLGPLIAMLKDPRFDPRSDEGRQELSPIAAAAALHGYALHVLRDPATRSVHVVLEETPSSPRRWGTLVFRSGSASNLVVQVPRPGLEPGSAEFGQWAFEQMQARLLVLAGALPLTRRDAASDANRVAGQGNLFALASQVMLRELRDEAGMVLQVRTIPIRPDLPLNRLPEADLLLWQTHQGEPGSLPGMFQMSARQQGFTIQPFHGQEETAGLRADMAPTARYLRATENKAFAVAWISPRLPRNLRRFRDNRGLRHQWDAVGLAPSEENLAETLASHFQPQALPAAFRRDLEAYLSRQDIVLLDRLRRRWSHLGLRACVDRASGRPYLIAGTNGPSMIASMDGQEPQASPWKPLAAPPEFSEARRLLAQRSVRIVAAGQP